MSAYRQDQSQLILIFPCIRKCKYTFGNVYLHFRLDRHIRYNLLQLYAVFSLYIGTIVDCRKKGINTLLYDAIKDLYGYYTSLIKGFLGV